MQPCWTPTLIVHSLEDSAVRANQNLWTEKRETESASVTGKTIKPEFVKKTSMPNPLTTLLMIVDDCFNHHPSVVTKRSRASLEVRKGQVSGRVQKDSLKDLTQISLIKSYFLFLYNSVTILLH